MRKEKQETQSHERLRKKKARDKTHTHTRHSNSLPDQTLEPHQQARGLVSGRCQPTGRRNIYDPRSGLRRQTEQRVMQQETQGNGCGERNVSTSTTAACVSVSRQSDATFMQAKLPFWPQAGPGPGEERDLSHRKALEPRLR